MLKTSLLILTWYAYISWRPWHGKCDWRAAKTSPECSKDEFGVTHKNIMYNAEENKAFCILDAPNKDAVEKSHQKFGMKCNWITEVKTTAWEKEISPIDFFWNIIMIITH